MSGLHRYYSDDHIETNEMGTACGMYGRDSRGRYRALWGYLRGRDHLEDLGVDGRVMNLRDV